VVSGQQEILPCFVIGVKVTVIHVVFVVNGRLGIQQWFVMTMQEDVLSVEINFKEKDEKITFPLLCLEADSWYTLLAAYMVSREALV
jgi:hypothetical protein